MSKKNVEVREVLVGQFESSKNRFRTDVHEIKVNFNWGKIIRKLLKTKKTKKEVL